MAMVWCEAIVNPDLNKGGNFNLTFEATWTLIKHLKKIFFIFLFRVEKEKYAFKKVSYLLHRQRWEVCY
jgi:hypothetical protein